MRINTPERQQLAHEIGIRIFDQRKRLSLTRKELAAQIGCSDRTIEYYEDGIRLPDIEVLVCLCEVLKLDANYLVGVRKVQI